MQTLLDEDGCYAAMQGRDARFDGWFVVAVRSTGVYCRPSCPARTPKRANVSFLPTAAAAQGAGYRACRRCRPEVSPGAPGFRGRSDVAARAMQLVLDGVVDREGVGGLARRVGYSERQLHRLLVAELGAGAAALARAQRAQTARVLLESSALPVTAVAFAAGFASVRQFNDTVRQVFARTPSEVRRASNRSGGARSTARRASRTASGQGARPADGAPVGITLRLAYRPPLASAELVEFLAARTIAGLETVRASTYRRSLRLPHGDGTVALWLEPAGPRQRIERGYVQASFHLADLRDLATAVARCRHLLNLDADPLLTDSALAADALLAPLVVDRPGLRVPGSVDGFEIAVRAVIGQQVGLQQARRVLAAVVAACDHPLAPEVADDAGLTHAFPGPDELAELLTERPELLHRLPRTRGEALVGLTAAVRAGDVVLDAGAEPGELRRRLLAVRGIGPWTAEYVAMRAVGDPDAFLPGDSGSRRAARRLGVASGSAALMERAQLWRPWRAHAQMHLWALDAAATGAAGAEDAEDAALPLEQDGVRAGAPLQVRTPDSIENERSPRRDSAA